ncbi:L-aspartate oxidase, partial [Rhodovulum imhoffii]
GVAAAVGPGDTPEAHARDTVAAGAGVVRPDVALHIVGAAGEMIETLAGLGTPFDRDEAGQFLLNREAAHAVARVVRVQGDQAGRAIMTALVRAVRAQPSVQVMEGAFAERLYLDKGHVCGVWLAPEGARPVLVRTPAVILAGGGAAGLYAATTNPPAIRGQMLGMAARAGAQIADAEFVQFHPTAIDTGGIGTLPLATEALRGAGAVLIDSEGRRIMEGRHDLADLAPRDIVARAVFACHRAGGRPMLDTRGALGQRLLRDFPTVAEGCAKAGIDPVTHPIPVVPAAHYHMGGIAVDVRGRSSLPGLWACGEAAHTGMHGANRLASNGLLEALVLGRAAARDVAGQVPETPAGPVDLCFAPGGAVLPAAAIDGLRAVMSAEVGVLRAGGGLRRALSRIAALETEASEADSFLNMTAAATLIAAAALCRMESRGAHFRTDLPDSDPAQARSVRMTLTEALSHRRQAEDLA